ncbi:hypothetical protein C1H46_040011 [Malus baccata]|uniref:peroxidase n=1 Tax=Malus baccata TaxID=106549 RepID=A0A540KJU8_MALBA|nr:hypothetical protein C1H46_040011 [Malus baccata]
MHLYDYFVQGCDDSILRNDTSTKKGEKGTPPYSLHGFQVVDAAKSELEDVYLGIVSCAYILVVIARKKIMVVGRPTWDVQLGQKDSLTPNATATMELPGLDSPLTKLKQKFIAKSFTEVEMVALSSSYTIGRASCWFFQDLIYNNDNDMDHQYVAKMQFAYLSIGGDVTVTVAKEAQLGASILRMHFHDYFVQGCNGPVLLDNTPTMEEENDTLPNKDSLCRFQVVNAAKFKL